MKHEILHRPSYALLKVHLAPGETVTAEAGTMVGRSPGIRMTTGMRGGMFGALKRKVLGGESFFVNTFTADESGEATFAPNLPGDIHHMELNGLPLFTQSGSYLASTTGIAVDTAWGGAKTFFSREGFFLLKISGVGDLFLSSYGALEEMTLKEGEKYIVDTGHMVAFAEGVGYRVTTAGGLKSTVFGSEGLVCELTGPGKILIQTRSIDAFMSWLLPKIPRPQ